MHLLSERNRSEFLAVPQLVRFTLARGAEGPEATLLIKSSTLTLKYLLRLKKFQLIIFRVADRWLAYGVRLLDDPAHPAVLWSLLEYDDEVQALQVLTEAPKCVVFLFNEIAVNVAWGEVDIDLSDGPVRELVGASILHPASENTAVVEVSKRIEEQHLGLLKAPIGYTLDLPAIPEWHQLRSHYVTNTASSSLISIFETDEGGQQEEIALWLIDNLRPTGAVKSPQINESGKVRELSDLLLTYELGTFLLESKTLSILARDTLPGREKLSRDVRKHIQKAIRQLVGGVKNIRRGYPITNLAGQQIQVERTQPPHVIVLIPELSLLSEATEFDGTFFFRVSREAGGFFHILDPSELLRIVQAAGMISDRSKEITPMEAFDRYLIERADRALKTDTPNFEILLRFRDSTE